MCSRAFQDVQQQKKTEAEKFTEQKIAVQYHTRHLIVFKFQLKQIFHADLCDIVNNISKILSRNISLSNSPMKFGRSTVTTMA